MEKLLSSKAQYKLLTKADLAPLVLALRTAARSG
jgi:hypothetical protein